MPVYRLFVHGADRGLLHARSPDAARRLAERAAKLAAGETEVELRVSAVGLKLLPRLHDALLAIVREYQAAIERERKRWGEDGARQVAEKGVDTSLVVPDRRTIHALEDRGLLIRRSRVVEHEKLRKGRWGHRLGGTEVQRDVAHVCRPTDLGLEYAAWHGGTTGAREPVLGRAPRPGDLFSAEAATMVWPTLGPDVELHGSVARVAGYEFRLSSHDDDTWVCTKAPPTPKEARTAHDERVLEEAARTKPWHEFVCWYVARKTERKAHAGFRVRPSLKGWAIYFGDIAGAEPQVNADADSVYGWFERTALRPLALEADEVRAKALGAV